MDLIVVWLTVGFLFALAFRIAFRQQLSILTFLLVGLLWPVLGVIVVVRVVLGLLIKVKV